MWELLREPLKQYGPFLVGVALLVWALIYGKLRPEREFDKSEKDIAAMRADYERQLTDQRKDLEHQLADMRTDRDYYRERLDVIRDRWSGDLDAADAASKIARRAIGRRS